MILKKDICFTTYFNAFDRKMDYQLRDKEPKNLKHAFKFAINNENNRKASRKLGRRDDPKLFNPKNNKNETNKAPTCKKPEEATISQGLHLLKKMNPLAFNSEKLNVGEKALVKNSHFNRKPRIQNYPYTT